MNNRIVFILMSIVCVFFYHCALLSCFAGEIKRGLAGGKTEILARNENCFIGRKRKK